MLNKIKGLVKEEQGQGMTEYGLLLAVVVVIVVAALATFKTSITALLKKVTDGLDAVIPG
ncbi:MAG: Flp/Fap pilin component [Clostridiaceae bacterium]|jgi:pilus assembly protein Flp/PilA|nr:Flp/Fap pilin component [Clostridiaceae bacterium]